MGLNNPPQSGKSEEITAAENFRFSRFILFATLHFGASILLGFMVFATGWGSALSDSYSPAPTIGIFSLMLIILQAPVALAQWVLIRISNDQTGLGLDSLISLGVLWSLLVGVLFAQLTRKRNRSVSPIKKQPNTDLH